MGSLVEGIIKIFVDADKKFERDLQSFVTNKEKIAFIRKTYPDMKAIRISEKLGISRERVRQLLVTLNLPTAFEPISIFSCIVCGISFEHPRKLDGTEMCKDCFMAFKRSIIVCFQCRKPFLMRTKDYIYRTQVRGYKRTFCSHKCKGVYMGKTYGFAAHPENMRCCIEAKRNVD